MIIDEKYIRTLIKPRKSSSRKGENGIVGIVGGSRLYHGAPALSALGALRSGSDLSYVFVPKVIADPIRSIAPDLIVYPLPDSKITLGNSNKILNFRKNIDSFVIGPGLINQKINGLIRLVSELQKKNIGIVLDAGAINTELLNNISGKNIIITAHLGEFSKLVNSELNNEENIKKSITSYAKEHNFTVIVKGKNDYISNGSDVLINTSGNSCMTKGGTGDILSGVIATYLSTGYNEIESSIIGTFVMGKTGELVYEKFGFQFLASEFLILLGNYIKKFNQIK